MNWDRIAGKWKKLKGNARQRWGKLSGDRLGVVTGQREHISGTTQETFGIMKEKAERQLRRVDNANDSLK
jgi:uncharacterized protein YjbJ (UPF0337 family)